MEPVNREVYVTSGSIYQDMVSRDVSLVSADVDQKHNGYAVVVDIGLQKVLVRPLKIQLGSSHYTPSTHQIIDMAEQPIG